MPRILVLEVNVESVIATTAAAVVEHPTDRGRGDAAGTEWVAVEYCREGRGGRHTASSRDGV